MAIKEIKRQLEANDDVKIRRLREKDLMKIGEIMRTGMVFNKLDRRGIIQHIKNSFYEPQNDEFTTYIYKLGTKIVGFISIGRDLGRDTFEISLLSVSPKLQRNGVATNLLKHAEKEIRRKNGRIIFIYTSSTHEYMPARVFYRKMGYAKVATVKDFFDWGDNKLVYCKKLKKQRAKNGYEN